MFGWFKKKNKPKLFMEDQVRNSIALLDRVNPGWADYIDRERLRMSDTDDCILGQLYGDYYEGVDILGIYETSNEYAFDLPSSEGSEWADWDQLQNTWLTLMPKKVSSLV